MDLFDVYVKRLCTYFFAGVVYFFPGCTVSLCSNGSRNMKPGGGRIKGRQFEYLVAKDLEADLGIKFQRVIEQTREAELSDLEPVDCPNFPFVLELKRYGTGTYSRPAWWDQVCAAASKAGKYPALIYRYDRLPVRCRVPIQALVGLSMYEPAADKNEQYDWRYAADLEWDTFMMVCREIMADV